MRNRYEYGSSSGTAGGGVRNRYYNTHHRNNSNLVVVAAKKDSDDADDHDDDDAGNDHDGGGYNERNLLLNERRQQQQQQRDFSPQQQQHRHRHRSSVQRSSSYTSGEIPSQQQQPSPPPPSPRHHPQHDYHDRGGGVSSITSWIWNIQQRILLLLLNKHHNPRARTPVRRRISGSSFSSSSSFQHDDDNNHEQSTVSSSPCRNWFVVVVVFPWVLLLSITILLLLVIVLLTSGSSSSPYTTLMGNGYSASGGILGDYIDGFLSRQYQRNKDVVAVAVASANRRKRIRNMDDSSTADNIVYPDVTIKANRKIERQHTSSYLTEILRRHQPNQTTTVTVTDVFHDPQTIQQQPRRPSRGGGGGMVRLHGTKNLLAQRTSYYSVEHELRANKCTSNWLCQRCLNYGQFGSYATCSMFCHKCYIRILSTVPYHKNSPVLSLSLSSSSTPEDEEEVDEQSQSSSIQQQQNEQRNRRKIPKIIHQAWNVPIRTLVYPELKRIQNTWRSISNYSYHYYDIMDAQQFVAQHFPTIISDVYRHRMYGSPHRQRDLFKLLILYKMGGIIANVDVMLETNLDALIRPDTSFVAARDPDDHDHCFFNGFVAAEPGHPLVGRAIENILEAILLLGGSGNPKNDDPSLAERLILSSVPNELIDDVPISKLRAVKPDSQEYIFGGCGLVVALNQIMKEENPVKDIELGHRPSVGGGNLLVLLMSRKDTGATRITDVERNLLVASSEMIGLDRTTVKEKSRRRQREARKDKAEIVE